MEKYFHITMIMISNSLHSTTVKSLLREIPKLLRPKLVF